MECRPFEVKLISANDIRNVNRFTTMDVYSFVLIAGDPRTRQRSPTDRYAGTSPKWNYCLHFTVDESDLQKGNLSLVFLLRSERHFGDRDIGEVQIPLKELLDSEPPDSNSNSDPDPDSDPDLKTNNREFRLMTCDLTTKAGRTKGTIDFSYLFGDKFTISSNPTPYIRSKTCPVPPRSARLPPQDEDDDDDDANDKDKQMSAVGGLLVAPDKTQTEDGGYHQDVAIAN